MKKCKIGVLFSLLWVMVQGGDIVMDSTNKLAWLDTEEAAFTRQTWENAQAYCKGLDVGGHKDWRLPSYHELLTIVDYSRHSPSVTASFQNSGSDYYWTSSPYGSEADSIWVIRFSDGSTGKSYKSYENYVRCVRGN